VVARLPAGGGNPRDEYSATLVREGDHGDVNVEANFWRGSSAPHDADKIAFRERARRAADQEQVAVASEAAAATEALPS